MYKTQPCRKNRKNIPICTSKLFVKVENPNSFYYMIYIRKLRIK